MRAAISSGLIGLLGSLSTGAVEGSETALAPATGSGSSSEANSGSISVAPGSSDVVSAVKVSTNSGISTASIIGSSTAVSASVIIGSTGTSS